MAAFVIWFKTAAKYEGGEGIDGLKHRTRAAAEESARTSPIGKAYGPDDFDVLPFKKMPKTYCEECDEYRCVCKEMAEVLADCSLTARSPVARSKKPASTSEAGFLLPEFQVGVFVLGGGRPCRRASATGARLSPPNC